MVARSFVASLALALLAQPWDAALAAENEPPEADATDVPAPAPPLDRRSAQAEECRRRALRFYDTGDVAAAREEFLRAYKLKPTFKLLYNLGVVSMGLGDSAGAYEYFERYLREGDAEVPSEAKELVRVEMRDLAEQIATVDVVVDVPGAEILVDEETMGKSPLPNALHLNGGFHRLSARVEGGGTITRTLRLRGRDRIRISLVVTLREPRPPAPPVSHGLAPWLWGGTGVLATGAAVAGIEALAANRRYDDELHRLGTTRSQLDAAGDRATRWSVTADVLGLAAIAGAAYALFTTLKPSPLPASAPAAEIDRFRTHF